MKCTGTRSRSRICLNKENGQQEYDFNCKPGKKNKNAKCLRTCKPPTPPLVGELSDKESDNDDSTALIGTKYLSIAMGCLVIALLGLTLLLYVRRRRKKKRQRHTVENNSSNSLNSKIFRALLFREKFLKFLQHFAMNFWMSNVTSELIIGYYFELIQMSSFHFSCSFNNDHGQYV